MGGFSSTANQFIDASLGLRDRQLQRARIVAGVGVVLAALTGTGAIFAGYQLQQAARQRVEQYAATSEALLNTNPTEGSVYAISAVGLSRSPLVKFTNYSVPRSVEKALFNAVQTSREENILQLPKSQFSSVVFSSSGQQILTTSNEDGVVREWDLQGSSFKELLRVPDASKWEVEIAPNGQQIITKNSDDKFQIWDSMGKPLGEPVNGPKKVNINGAEKPIYMGEVSPDGQWIVMYTQVMSTEVSLWNLQDYSRGHTQDFKGEPLQLYTFEGGAEQTAYSVFSYSGHWLTGGGVGEKEITIVDLRKSPIKKKLILPIEQLTFAVLSPDGHRLAAGDGDGNVYIWNISIDEIMQSTSNRFSLQKSYSNILPRGHTDGVKSIAFSSDGQRLATSSQDGTIRLWSMNSLQPIGEPLRVQKSAVTFVSFSLDGKRIVSRSSDGVVRLWDTQGNPSEEGLQYIDRSLSISRSNGMSRLVSVEFSLDNQHIIVKGNNTWAGLYEQYLAFDLQGQPASEKQEKEIVSSVDPQPGSNLNSEAKLSFSPDGKKIVSIANDGMSIRMYGVSLESWLKTACNRLRYHSVLSKPTTDVARQAKATCEQYVWSVSKLSETLVTQASSSPQYQEPVRPLPDVTPTPMEPQPLPTPTEKAPSPTALTRAYKFEFPQASCGDSSAKPSSAFPVFIDDRTLEEVRSKYCVDAYPVSKRQKTGQPSVQVASFTDRQKAEAFAKEVGGEVGEP